MLNDSRFNLSTYLCIKSQIMKKYTLLFTLLSALLFLNGCKENKGCTDITAVNFESEAEEDDGSCAFPSVSVDIHHKVGGETLTLGNTYDINGTKVRIDRVQYYLAGIDVTGDNPTTFTDKVLLVDPNTISYELGDAKVGHTHMIRFNVGVPAELNTGVDPTTYSEDDPLYPQIPSMDWGWQAGYKFFVIEGEVDSDGDDVVDSNLEIHLGQDAYYTPVMIEIHSDISDASHAIHLEADIANLFTDISDISTNSVTHVGDNIGLADEVKANLPLVFSHQ